MSLNCSKLCFHLKKMFTLGADKTRFIINHGIAPYFYEILKANVNLAELKTKVDSLKKVNEQLDEESETFLFDADANSTKASYFIAKATALKRKKNENKDEIKVLEEAIKINEKKRSKENK